MFYMIEEKFIFHILKIEEIGRQVPQLQKVNLIKQNNFGSLKNLELSSSTLSSLKENDILIEVYCCGISFADVLAVEGKYQVDL